MIKEIKFLLIGWSILFYLISLKAQTNIAVIEFSGKNISKDETSILTDRLIIELVNTNKFTVLEREKMDEILKEQGFQISGCTSNECVVEIGQLTGVEKVVAGSIGKVGDIYSISARIVSVETGKILATATYDYKGDIGNLLEKGMKIISLKLAGDKFSEKTIKTRIIEKIIVVNKLRSIRYQNEMSILFQAHFPGNSNFANNTQNMWQVMMIELKMFKFLYIHYGASNKYTMNKTIPLKGNFINKSDLKIWFGDAMLGIPIPIGELISITPSIGYLYSIIEFISYETGEISFINNGMITELGISYYFSLENLNMVFSFNARKLFFADYDNWIGTGFKLGFLF
ncbi:MAG: hypothetical protein KAW56_00610 [Candidatus Marinimicrobia bacterium]|nr:hypothetical protein [Candidatus Neomarinimicrobiota bacterium]